MSLSRIPESSSTLQLRDGRTLGVASVGKTDGFPIFHFHGNGTSRLEVLTVQSAAESLGVRLIGLDRPGIGRSDARADYRLLDWPDDVVEVADQLGKAVHAVLGTPLRSPLAQMRREQTPNFYGFSAHVLPRPADWPNFCHVTGYWFLDTKPAWSPPADLEAFLQAGPKPVYIGFGSMRGADERGLTEQVVSALQRCGQRGILLTGWGAIAHVPLPETIFRPRHGWFTHPGSDADR